MAQPRIPAILAPALQVHAPVWPDDGDAAVVVVQVAGPVVVYPSALDGEHAGRVRPAVAAGATGLPQAGAMRYATKAAWAAAKASELRQQAGSIGYTSNWRRARGNSDARHNLRREAERFERMAERFAAQGK